MDAISFVLAISTKYLRSQNLQDLVYHSEENEKSASTCSVALFYQTDAVDHELTESVEAGVEIEFFRRVNANGSSQYKVNGQQISCEAYIRKLADLNILVNCRNFLVYQGDVQNISTRSPEELTLLFEQLSGSFDMKEEYERLRERREKLKAVMDMNLKKKYTMISEKKIVQEQKEEADEFQKKLSLLRDLRVEYFLWQLFNVQSNLDQHMKKIDTLKTEGDRLDGNDSVGEREGTERVAPETGEGQPSARGGGDPRGGEEGGEEAETGGGPHQADAAREHEAARSSAALCVCRRDGVIGRNESQRCASELSRLEGEEKTLEEENRVLTTELERMHATLRTLAESTPTESGVGVPRGCERRCN